MPFTNQIGWAADPKIDYRTMYPFDPAKANALLDAAGIARDAQGTRFKVRFLITSDDVDNVSVVAAIKSMWAAAGIDVQIEMGDRATALKRVYLDRDYDVTINGYGSYNEPAFGLARIFTSSGIVKPYGNGSVYSNPKVDELFAMAETAMTLDERGVYYREVQAILAEDLPVFTLRDKALMDVVSVNLRDYLQEAHASSWRKAWIAQ